MRKREVAAFVHMLKGYKDVLTRSQYIEVKGQALSGKLEAARSTLRRILNERSVKNAEFTGNFDR